MAALTTELDALNTILDCIGVAPVSSVSDPSLDVLKARNTLAQVSREVQSQGWHWNTDTEYPLTRDGSGQYVLPSNILRIDTADSCGDRDVVARQGKLWDRDNRTWTFSTNLKFNIVWLFEFEELPEAARNYITLRAARRFQQRALGSGTLSRFNEADEAQAYAILREAEADTEDSSIFQSWSVSRVLNRDPTSEW